MVPHGPHGSHAPLRPSPTLSLILVQKSDSWCGYFLGFKYICQIGVGYFLGFKHIALFDVNFSWGKTIKKKHDVHFF